MSLGQILTLSNPCVRKGFFPKTLSENSQVVEVVERSKVRHVNYSSELIDKRKEFSVLVSTSQKYEGVLTILKAV